MFKNISIFSVGPTHFNKVSYKLTYNVYSRIKKGISSEKALSSSSSENKWYR